jgi:hemoglobin/transferrin/lactoferrin receptor protein
MLYTVLGTYKILLLLTQVLLKEQKLFLDPPLLDMALMHWEVLFIIILKALFLKGLKKIKSSFTTNYTSANQGISNNFVTNYSGENWGSITSLSISKFGDIKMGEQREHGFNSWGLTPLYSENSRYSYYSQASTNSDENIQKNTSYSQVDLFQKFLLKLGDTNLLNVNIQFSESSDIDRYDQLSITKEGGTKI